jgi:hypothetical protein
MDLKGPGLIPTLEDLFKQLMDLKGCGSPMNWSEIPPLDKELLNELMDTGLLDFLNDKRAEPAEHSKIFSEFT